MYYNYLAKEKLWPKKLCKKKLYIIYRKVQDHLSGTDYPLNIELNIII